jgi:hypothetical protein
LISNIEWILTHKKKKCSKILNLTLYFFAGRD